MSLWGRIFAAGYDRMMEGTERAGLAQRRHGLLQSAHGRVLEIGGGTGANLIHYPAAVRELVITEPEEPMARRLEARLAASASASSSTSTSTSATAAATAAAAAPQIVRAPAERLPFEDDSFDFVVSTLVLCTVSDQRQALDEIHRVLRPDGRLLFLEHVRAPEPALARWQDRLHPLWVRFGHGCNCNRPTLENIRAAAFAVGDLEHGEIPNAPPIVRPLIVGSAAPV